MLKYPLSDFYWLFLAAIVLWGTMMTVVRILFKWWRFNIRHDGFSLTYLFLTAVGFAFLGLTIGLLAGLSKSPVVGVLVPALLTFYGGVISYVFILDKAIPRPENRVVLLIGMLSMSFFMTLGSDYGAAMRTVAEEREARLQYQREKDLEMLKLELVNPNAREKEGRGEMEATIPAEGRPKTNLRLP